VGWWGEREGGRSGSVFPFARYRIVPVPSVLAGAAPTVPALTHVRARGSCARPGLVCERAPCVFALNACYERIGRCMVVFASAEQAMKWKETQANTTSRQHQRQRKRELRTNQHRPIWAL